VHHLTSRYVLFLLALLIVLGNNVAVQGQAINLCEIASLTFNYPNPVPADRPLTVITTIALYSCPAGPLSARVDLFDSRQNLISSSSGLVNSPRVDVTNTFAAPPTSGQHVIYVAAYMILFGSVVGSYRSSFELSVVPRNQMTMGSASLLQSFTQTTLTSTTSSTFTTGLAQNTLASVESTSTAFAPTISKENFSTIASSGDFLYELVILFAMIFIVTLVILSVRRRKKN
jgi:hypothetical protein